MGFHYYLLLEAAVLKSSCCSWAWLDIFSQASCSELLSSFSRSSQLLLRHRLSWALLSAHVQWLNRLSPGSSWWDGGSIWIYICPLLVFHKHYRCCCCCLGIWHSRDCHIGLSGVTWKFGGIWCTMEHTRPQMSQWTVRRNSPSYFLPEDIFLHETSYEIEHSTAFGGKLRLA